MAIYDADGNEINAIWNADGNALDSAYDCDGNKIYESRSPIMGDLRIMAYNVGGWWVGRATSVPASQDVKYYALQNKILNNWLPDILCIEEYRDEFTVGGRTALSVLSPYFQYIESLDGDGSVGYIGHAICSKYPILSFTKHNYGSDKQRYYSTAVIDVNGTEISVVVTHISTNGNARISQVTHLFNYAETLTNAIVCGDFNLHCHSKTDVYEGTGLVEWESYRQWVEAGYHMANNSDEFGFMDTYFSEAYDQWYSLDNIIVSPNITINNAYVDTTKRTEPITSDPNWKYDHSPLIADISIN